MGQPHEDLQTLYAMKGRLEESGEMAKTLGLDNGGEAGNIYQALVQVSALVDNEIKAMRNIVDPHENRYPYSPNFVEVEGSPKFLLGLRLPLAALHERVRCLPEPAPLVERDHRRVAEQVHLGYVA